MMANGRILESYDLFGLRPSLVDWRNRFAYLLNRDLRRKNREVIRRGMPDRLAVPPIDYVYLTSRRFDIARCYQNGEQGVGSMKALLRSQSVSIRKDWSVLDFGCGCGRLSRVWHRHYGGNLCGVDCNARLVDWCRENFPFGTFLTNSTMDPLEFSEETFDFVYAVSVFTHLSEEHQDFWLGELTRVVKKGGWVYLTVHGPDRLEHLSEEERGRFHQGEPVVHGEQFAGENACGVYHPESYIRDRFSRHLELMTYVRGGARDVNQDAYLFQRRG